MARLAEREEFTYSIHAIENIVFLHIYFQQIPPPIPPIVFSIEFSLEQLRN
jgi:hypothetical protein